MEKIQQSKKQKVKKLIVLGFVTIAILFLIVW